MRGAFGTSCAGARHPEPRNYEEWIYRNVGTSFGDTFLIPYSEKFRTVHPREMTHTWTGNRVPQPSTRQVLRGALWSKQTRIGTNSTFSYPQNGLGYGAIADALAQRAKVYLEHRATRVEAGRHCIRFEGDRKLTYKVLLSTIPLPELVQITVDAPLAVREAAEKLRTNSISWSTSE